MAGTPGTKRSISMAELAEGSDSSLIWQGSRIANAPPSALWAGAPAPDDNEADRTIQFFDDFLQQASATASAYANRDAPHELTTRCPRRPLRPAVFVSDKEALGR
jgi:hypothetical protein